MARSLHFHHDYDFAIDHLTTVAYLGGNLYDDVPDDTAEAALAAGAAIEPGTEAQPEPAEPVAQPFVEAHGGI